MNKLTAIEQTIYNLENDVYRYSWSDVESCNCGILAKTLLGGDGVIKNGFHESPIGKGVGCFSRRAHCISTNLPLPTVFQKLKDSGFTHKELCDLEFLSDRAIAKKANIEVGEWIGEQEAAHGQFAHKQYLIRYLKAWAELLREQQPSPIPSPQEVKQVIKYVGVPESLMEQTKELIEN